MIQTTDRMYSDFLNRDYERDKQTIFCINYSLAKWILQIKIKTKYKLDRFGRVFESLYIIHV